MSWWLWLYLAGIPVPVIVYAAVVGYRAGWTGVAPWEESEARAYLWQGLVWPALWACAVLVLITAAIARQVGVAARRRAFVLAWATGRAVMRRASSPPSTAPQPPLAEEEEPADA